MQQDNFQTGTQRRLSILQREVVPKSSLRSLQSAVTESGGRSVENTVHIHIQKLIVADECLEYLALNFESDVELYIKWNFMNFEESSTPKTKFNDMCQHLLEYSIIYKCELNKQFVKYLSRQKLYMDLVAKDKQHSCIIAKTKIILSQVLDQEDLRDEFQLQFLADKDTENGLIPFAETTIFIKLKCEKGRIKQLIELIAQEASLNDSVESFDSASVEYMASKAIKPTESEIKSFKEALDLVLIRNKALKTTQSEISKELRDRARWLHEESDWRRTLQEHAILKEQDPSNIPWRQWRNSKTAKLKLRNYPSKILETPPELSISIKSLQLYKHSSVMQNDDITKLYIEYAFLDYEGPEMETPYSLPKQENIVFNFTKIFPFSPKYNKIECEMFSNEVRTHGKIHFVVISEPTPTNDKPIQTCHEVGYVKVDTFDIVESLENEWEDNHNVINCNNHEEIIGTLKIRFKGILALRKITLLSMAPSNYNIIS